MNGNLGQAWNGNPGLRYCIIYSTYRARPLNAPVMIKPRYANFATVTVNHVQ